MTNICHDTINQTLFLTEPHTVYCLWLQEVLQSLKPISAQCICKYAYKLGSYSSICLWLNGKECLLGGDQGSIFKWKSY